MYTTHVTVTLLLNLVRLSRLTVVFVSAVFSLAASTCNYVQFEAHDLKLSLASFMMEHACLVRLATGVYF